jgi:hypothetical protein
MSSTPYPSPQPVSPDDPFGKAYREYLAAVKQAWAEVDIDALVNSVGQPTLPGFNCAGSVGSMGSAGTWGGTLGTLGTLGSWGCSGPSFGAQFSCFGCAGTAFTLGSAGGTAGTVGTIGSFGCHPLLLACAGTSGPTAQWFPVNSAAGPPCIGTSPPMPPAVGRAR